MADNFGRRFLGGLANFFAPGRVYDSRMGWAPRNVTIGKLISGVAGQAGPAGTIAGLLGNAYVNNTPEGQAWQAGQDGWKGLEQQMADNGQSIRDYLSNVRPGVPNLQFGPNVNIPTMPSVQAKPPQGINWTPNNWQDAAGQHQQDRMAQTMEQREQAGYGGGGGGSTRYNAAVAAMGSRGTGGGNGFQWTGVSGDAARGVFSGMRDGSDAAIKQSEYLAWVRGQNR